MLFTAKRLRLDQPQTGGRPGEAQSQNQTQLAMMLTSIKINYFLVDILYFIPYVCWKFVDQQFFFNSQPLEQQAS